MANHKSAETRIRRNERKAVINGMRRSRTRTFIKNTESAISEGNKELAKTALLIAESELMRGASKGVVNKKRASRKISRLSARIKAL